MFSSIRSRIIFYIVGPVVVIFLVVLAVFYLRWERQAKVRADEELTTLAQQQSRQFDFALRSVMSVADSISNALEAYPNGSSGQLFAHIESSVREHPLVYGSAIAFAPNAYPGRRLFSPYVHRTPQGVRRVDIATVYDYTQPRWEWWSKTVKAGHSVWTEPYFDEGAGNILMSTYAVPFFHNGRLQGVATVDISLQELNKNMPWPQRAGLSFFVVTPRGRFIYPVAGNQQDAQTLFEESKRQGQKTIAELAMRMTQGRQGLASVVWDGAPSRVGFAPLGKSGWSIGARLTEAAIMDAAASRIRQAMLILALMLLVIVTVVYFVTGKLLRPLSQLNQATQRIAQGDLQTVLDIRRSDELGQLASAFHNMTQRLREREQTLRDSRGERLAMVLEGLGGKFFTYSLEPNGNLAHVSPLVERALGYKPEEFATEFRRLFTGSTVNRGARAHTEAALRGESTPAYEVEMRHKDGRVRRMEICERPVHGERGEVVAVDALVGDVTERAQAAEWFRDLVESTPEALILTDPTGRIVLVNQRTEQIFGYAREELIGRDAQFLCASLQQEDSPGWQWNTLEANRREGRAVPPEIFGQRKNGDVFPIELSQSALQLEQDEHVLVSTVVRDITQRRQAEEKLRQVNEQLAARTQELARALRHTSRYFKSIMDNSPAAIWAKDGDGVYLFANNAYREIFNVGDREIEGCTDDDFFPAGVAEGFRVNDRRVIERQMTERVVEPVGGVGGVDYVVSVKFPLFDEQRNVVAAGGICLDITEQLKMQEELKTLNEELEKRVERRTAELQASKERFKAIVENMQGGYLQASLDGVVQYANPGITQILGYDSPDELLGKSMERDFYWDAEDRLRLIEAMRESGAVEDFEVAFRRKDGTPVWTEDSVHFVYDADGRPTGLEGLLRDVTLQREAREALERARQAADAANQAKSDFLANMSHEIRTPMNAILGLTHLALQTDLDARQRNYLGKIDNSARNLLGILNDILDFSKIEAGKLHIEQSAFNLEEVLHNVAELFVMKAEEKGVELLFHWTPGVPAALVGDALRLSQVLVNLVSNALKFTEQGEIEVKVEKKSENTQGVTLQFSVRDTGIGLNAEQLGRLFQAFTQADASITRRYGGTGLGLTICKRLVELMEGRIWVESAAGVGSIFYFTVTLPRQAVVAESEPEELKQLAGLRVLVVDDNATAREILRSMLESFRFECVPAQSGAEAIQILQRAGQPFDLIIMDWQMPGMNGFETIGRLRTSVLPFPLPPVMMVSAHGREELMRQAQGLDISHYLIKPVNPSILLDSALQVLGIAAQGMAVKQAPREIGKELAALRGAHVLIVEDVEINREIVCEILGGVGIEVTSTENGQEGILAVQAAAAAGTAYDAVLMDCQMPVLDGYEATRRLRRDERFKDLPIIAMTANAMEGDAEKCLAAGMNDYVPKPIHVPELFAALVRWIKTVPAAGSLLSLPAAAATRDENEELHLPGIDVADGLRHVSGNAQLYRRILLKFRDGQAGVVAQIRAARAAGDAETAARLAHTLKGLAGSIGALPLAQAVPGLEAALRENQENELETLLQKVDAELALVLAGIESNLTGREAEPDTSASPRPVDREALAPLLEQLHVALLDNDANAVKIVEQLRSVLSDTAEGVPMKKIARAAENYDFDRALKLLAEWEQSRE